MIDHPDPIIFIDRDAAWIVQVGHAHVFQEVAEVIRVIEVAIELADLPVIVVLGMIGDVEESAIPVVVLGIADAERILELVGTGPLTFSELVLVVEVLIEGHDAEMVDVGDVDVAIRIGGDGPRHVEIVGAWAVERLS